MRIAEFLRSLQKAAIEIESICGFPHDKVNITNVATTFKAKHIVYSITFEYEGEQRSMDIDDYGR